MANGASNGMTYTLNFVNNSDQVGSVCVYQSDPNIGNPDVMSLAWFTQPCAPQTGASFSWQIEYSFIWDQTGTLGAGVTFTASENLDADLTSTNQVTLTTDEPSGAYAFANQGKGSQDGTLYIVQDGSIPTGKLSCGIGMYHSGIYAVQAEPNETAEFTPHPVYWITFGNHVHGEVLDVTTITNAAQVVFPPNVYSVTATLTSQNTWIIQ